jgi:hypothetical protein
MPGQAAGDMRPGDPVVVSFSKPMDRASLAEPGALTLTRDGKPVAADWVLDGAVLHVRPDQPLAFGERHVLHISDTVTDLAGNPLSRDYSLGFTMPAYVGNGDRAPIVTSLHPGFPCATTDRDLTAGHQGRCAGGRDDDDRLPIPPLPANQPIQVQFSQTMLGRSIRLGGSFRVERNDSTDGDGVWRAVPGRLETGARSLRFRPDRPWEPGVLYRYVLSSNSDAQSAAANCHGASAICSERPDGTAGFPLQTRLLAQSAARAPTPTAALRRPGRADGRQTPSQRLCRASARSRPTVDRRLFATYVGIVAVSTLSVTSAIIGVVAVINGDATDVVDRIPYYVFFMALVFTGLVFLLERNLDDGRRILTVSFAIAALSFVLALLGVEGVFFALDNQDQVLSNITLYFLSAGLACTGIVYWAVHHWREFVSSSPRARHPR